MKPSKHFGSYVVFALGLVLALYAGQRSLALAWLAYERPTETVLSLDQGDKLDAVVIDQAIEAYQRAVVSLPQMSDGYIQLGRLALRRSILLEGEQLEAALLSASGAFRRAIAASPSDPFGWSLMALTLDQMGRPVEQIEPMLRYSEYLGSQEASSILLRVPVGLRQWDGLPDDMREGIRRDIRRLWRYPALRPDLVSLYLETSLPQRIIIRETVLTSADAQRKFDRLLTAYTGIGKRR